jgi:hypothetical protein
MGQAGTTFLIDSACDFADFFTRGLETGLAFALSAFNAGLAAARFAATTFFCVSFCIPLPVTLPCTA